MTFQSPRALGAGWYFAGYWEISAGVWDNRHESTADVAATPVFRFERGSVYVEGAVGFHLVQTRISAEDNASTLHDRLGQMGAELLARTIPDYVAGKIAAQKQPAEGASYARKIKKEDARIDWNLPARRICNKVRAFVPWPVAFT